MPNHDYVVSYVHQISQLPSDQDCKLAAVEPADLTDRKTLGACLRRQGVIGTGVRVSRYKVEESGRIVIWPTQPPGMTTGWLSLSLRPHPPTVTLETKCPCCERPMKVYQRPTCYGHFQKDDVDTCETCTSPIRLKDGAVVRRYE